MKNIRRKDREVTDFNKITDILRRSDTLRIGLSGDIYPYVVPLSYGYEAVNGEITIYIHGAKEGFKHELIKNNPAVCVETDILHRYASNGAKVTAEYESFIGFGKTDTVYGDAAKKGLDLILEHCGYSGLEYDTAALNVTRVYKIKLDAFTAKRNFNGAERR